MNRPPDVIYTDLDAISDGTLVDISAIGLRCADRHVDRVTRGVWVWLAENLPSIPSYVLLLKVALAGAKDTAGDGEPEGYLYELPTTVTVQEIEVPIEPLWLVANERDALTLMFPNEY